jgi:hypothetical protein
VIRGESLASNGSWRPAPFLVDTGAGRTVFSAPILALLRLQPITILYRLGGVGDEADAVVVETQIRCSREESGCGDLPEAGGPSRPGGGGCESCLLGDHGRSILRFDGDRGI